MKTIYKGVPRRALGLAHPYRRSPPVSAERGMGSETFSFGDSARIAVLVAVFSTMSVAAHFNSWALILASLVISTIVAFYTSVVLRLSIYELTVVAIPVTFYPPLAGQINVALSDLLLPMLILLAFFEKRTVVRFRDSTSSIIFYALAIQASGLLSLVVAANTFPLFSSSAGIIAAIKISLVSTYLLAFYIFTRNRLINDDYKVVDIWAMTAVVSATIGLVAIGLRVLNVDIGLTYSYRVSGTFEDPNAFGAYLLLSAGVVMWAKFIRTGSGFSLQLVPIALAILLTGSRGVIVSVVLGSILTILTTMHKRSAAPFFRTIIAGGFVIGMVIALLPRSVTSDPLTRATSVFSSPGGEPDVRFDLWQSAIDLWNSSPLVGVGLGHFRIVTAGAQDISLVSLAHNTYLSFLAETGIIGFFAIVSLPGIVLVRLILHANDTRMVFLLFGLASVLVLAFTLNLENFRPLWVFLAVCLAVLDVNPITKVGPPRSPKPRISANAEGRG